MKDYANSKRSSKGSGGHSERRPLGYLSLVTLIGLGALVGISGSAASQAVAPEAAAEERTLVRLPFFATNFDLTEKALGVYDRWSRKLLTAALENKPAFGLVEAEKDIAPETLSSLAGSNVRRVTDLLSPVTEAQNAEGALAVWIEKPKPGTFQIGLLLYLPNGIRLDEFKVSTNIEREPVPVNEEKKIEKKAFQEALDQALARSLSRVDISPPPPSVPPAEEARAPEGTSGEMPEEAQVDSSEEGAPAEVEEEGDDGEDGGDRGGAGKPAFSASVHLPLTLGVLPFSHELDRPDSRAALEARDFPFTTEVRRITSQWPTLVGSVRPLAGPSLSSTQMSATTLTLDPHADPKARERRLEKICQEQGVDALLFGHLEESSQSAKGPKSLRVRFFLPANLEVFSQIVSWGGNQGSLRTALELATRSVFQNASLLAEPGFRWYEIERNDTLFDIAKKCYGGKVGRVIEAIKARNQLEDENKIFEGSRLKLSVDIDGTALRDRCR